MPDDSGRKPQIMGHARLIEVSLVCSPVLCCVSGFKFVVIGGRFWWWVELCVCCKCMHVYICVINMKRKYLKVFGHVSFNHFALVFNTGIVTFILGFQSKALAVWLLTWWQPFCHFLLSCVGNPALRIGWAHQKAMCSGRRFWHCYATLQHRERQLHASLSLIDKR